MYYVKSSRTDLSAGTMFVIKAIAFYIFAVLALSESKFVETLSKCSIEDGVCQAALVTTALKTLHKAGAAELGIPPIDPIEFKDIKITLLDLIDLTIIEGTAKGIKDCIVDSFDTEIEKGRSEMKMTCNSLVLKAKYRLSGSNPLLKTLFGGDTIHGEGNAKVKIDKIQFIFNYFYNMEKNSEGEVYFDCKYNKTQYVYKTLGKVSVDADNIYIGKIDASELIVGFLNENSKFIMNTFGKAFVDQAMDLVYLYSHKFFDTVPAKYFIIEDLSKYVKS